MPRFLAILLGILITVLTSPAHAGSCDWVRSVVSWNATLGWSWYSLKSVWTEPSGGGTTVTFEALTQDAGGASGLLDQGYSGADDVELGEGTATGSLRFLDRLDSTSSEGHSAFTQYIADGPITGNSGPLPFLDLYLDLQSCTYHWRFDAYAAATMKTDTVTIPIANLDVNAIQSGERPIPAVAGPLEFDGALHASSGAPADELTAWFRTAGDAAYRAEHNAYEPRSFPDASVHWHFAPSTTAAPDNDACTGARILLGSQTEDTSSATNASTDPVSACGTGDESVWFFYVPEATGTAQISTVGSDHSTVVSVWQVAQTCGGLTAEVACGANRASVPVQVGVPLFVQVQRSGGAGGTAYIQVTPQPPAGPVVGWGYDNNGQATPPAAVNGTAGMARAIAAGIDTSCAIQAPSGAVVCWGRNDDGQATPPAAVNGTAGTASAIAAGFFYSCAIQAPSGAVVCWGDNTGGEATPPAAVNGTAGTASAIAAGIGVACAIQAGTGAVVCWGSDSGFGSATPPPSVNGTSGTATAIAAGRAYNCAIRASDRAVVCWGRNDYGQATPPDAVNGTAGTARAIAATASGYHTCAIQAGSEHAVCWGYSGYGETSPPATVAVAAGAASAVAAGEEHSCAIRGDNGAVVCWGDDSFGQSTPPSWVSGAAGTASAIAAGEYYTLAIATPEPDALALAAAALAAVAALRRARGHSVGRPLPVPIHRILYALLGIFGKSAMASWIGRFPVVAILVCSASAQAITFTTSATCNSEVQTGPDFVQCSATTVDESTDPDLGVQRAVGTAEASADLRTGSLHSDSIAEAYHSGPYDLAAGAISRPSLLDTITIGGGYSGIVEVRMDVSGAFSLDAPNPATVGTVPNPGVVAFLSTYDGATDLGSASVFVNQYDNAFNDPNGFEVRLEGFSRTTSGGSFGSNADPISGDFADPADVRFVLTSTFTVTPSTPTFTLSAYLYTHTAFSKGNVPGDQVLVSEVDFGKSAHLSLDLPEGVSWTSASGVFLTSSVPEPDTGALLAVAMLCLIAGRHLRGSTGRTRSRSPRA